MRGFRQDSQQDSASDATPPNNRRGFTRYVSAARDAAAREAREFAQPEAEPRAQRRLIHAPQAKALSPEEFASEIEAWMVDAEADASDLIDARNADEAASFSGDDLLDDDNTSVLIDDELDDGLFARSGGPAASRQLRFETRARTFDDDLYDRFDDDDDLGAPGPEVIEAVRAERAHGGRARGAALFAVALVAAAGAISYSVDRALDSAVGTGAISTASIPDQQAAPIGMWRDAVLQAAPPPRSDPAPTVAPRTELAPSPTHRIETRTISTTRQAAAIGQSDAISPYLGAEEIRELLNARPVKCILSQDDAKRAQIFGSANSQAFGHGGDGCETMTDYNVETGRYTRRSLIERDATLEISARFTVNGDQICHDLSHMAVLVLGDGLPFADALALEEKVKDGYARRGDESVCYKIRDLSASLGKHAYRADVVESDLYQPERSDPRPFLMRPRF